MKKRQFLKTSSLMVGGQFLMPMISCKTSNQVPPRRNWAGNFTYSTAELESPNVLEGLRSAVRKYERLKALGTRHSFNDIADSEFRQLSLRNMDNDIQINPRDQTVSFTAGIQYGVLASKLEMAGLSLHNLASLPHISVAGACATGTHGSGDRNGNLATMVTEMEMVTAEGELIKLSKDQHVGRFNGTVVHLGALGIVTRMTLSVSPTFSVCQYVYENLPLKQLEDNFEAVFSSGYSVSLFTDWKGDTINQLWIKKKVEDIGAETPMEQEFLQAVSAPDHLHPIREISAIHCTEQMGIPGPWHERLPHFKMDFTPSSGEELQSEFFVPREHAVEAISAMYRMGGEISPHLLISEIRSIAADRLWLSPAYGRDSIAIHFTWKQDWPNVQKLLPKIEKELMPYQVRPHWGKLFTLSRDHLETQYDRMDDFRKLVQEYDPKGKFRNAFLERNILT
ncbi:D-arabinono-1,4-lactone oxidase [Negadavirga shengliensis]|uniref:D-arabinono-1,4-lactone oxidase n=1 Tax=Negadavirga shengliensis TaxID=1389218 RepID=A0ABV9T4C3_9BACT